MIEMLGVLAIVGVLSVAGIAGYSKAMAKYKVNKLVDQVSTVAANVRTTFAGQGNYKGLDSQTAYSLGIYPEEIAKSCDINGEYSVGCLKNAMGGGIYVNILDGDSYAFNLAIGGLTKEACSALVTSDWGLSSAFLGISLVEEGNNDTNVDDAAVINEPMVTPADIQQDGAVLIAEACYQCPTDNSCGLVLTFK